MEDTLALFISSLADGQDLHWWNEDSRKGPETDSFSVATWWKQYLKSRGLVPKALEEKSNSKKPIKIT